MHSIRRSSSLIRLLTSTTSYWSQVASCSLPLLRPRKIPPDALRPAPAFSTLHMPGLAGLGPALEGDVNFGRYISLDGSLSWFPTRPGGQSAATGFFGAKAGKRTERFGFFGKARPGFLTFDNAFRGETTHSYSRAQRDRQYQYPFLFPFWPAHATCARRWRRRGILSCAPLGSSAGTLAICSCFQTSPNIHLHWRRNTGSPAHYRAFPGYHAAFPIQHGHTLSVLKDAGTSTTNFSVAPAPCR